MDEEQFKVVPPPPAYYLDYGHPPAVTNPPPLPMGPPIAAAPTIGLPPPEYASSKPIFSFSVGNPKALKRWLSEANIRWWAKLLCILLVGLPLVLFLLFLFISLIGLVVFERNIFGWMQDIIVERRHAAGGGGTAAAVPPLPGMAALNGSGWTR